MDEKRDAGVRYKGLPDDSKDKACERHNVWYVKNLGGDEYCPVCTVEERMIPEKTVYLAGSVQFVEDGKTWREKIMDDYSDVNWVSPYNSPYTWTDDKHEAFMWCKQQVLRSDAVLIRYKKGEETWGTPSEMIWAWEYGVPVYVWQISPPGIVPNFVEVAAESIDKKLERIIEERLV